MLTRMLEIRIKNGLSKTEIINNLRINPKEYELMELGLMEIPKELEEKINMYINKGGV